MRNEHSDAMAISSLNENVNFGEALKILGWENILFELYKRKTTVIVSRERFLNVVCGALSAYKYVGPDQRADLLLACRYMRALSFYCITSDSFPFLKCKRNTEYNLASYLPFFRSIEYLQILGCHNAYWN